MDDKKIEGFVDELIEASLRHYGNEEPRAGLENRVLASVRARERASRQRTRWVWALGAAAAAIAIVGAALHAPRHVVAPGTLRAPLSAAVPTAPSIELREPLPPPKPARRPSRSARLARQEEFPTPAPLAEQEKLLLLYVRAQPGSALQASKEDRSRLDFDLAIPKLTIAALEPVHAITESERESRN